MFGIDLDDDHIGRLGGRQRNVHGNTQIEPAERIGRRSLNQGIVNGNMTFLKQGGHRIKIHGGEKTPGSRESLDHARSLIDGAHMITAAFRFFRDQPHERPFQIEKANNFHIGKMVRVVNERVHEMLRLAAVRADENPFTAGDGTDRLSSAETTLS